MATRGELRFCFYYDGQLNYFPEPAPWSFSTEYCERHQFRGYLEMPPESIPELDQSVEFLFVRRSVQSLHSLDGRPAPAPRLADSSSASEGGFARPKPYKKADEEVFPVKFFCTRRRCFGSVE